MKQISYLAVAICISISAMSQFNKEDINKKLHEIGLDSSSLNSEQYSKQLLKVWSISDHETNKFNPYIILPIKLWEEIFEKQTKKRINHRFTRFCTNFY